MITNRKLIENLLAVDDLDAPVNYATLNIITGSLNGELLDDGTEDGQLVIYTSCKLADDLGSGKLETL